MKRAILIIMLLLAVQLAAAEDATGTVVQNIDKNIDLNIKYQEGTITVELLNQTSTLHIDNYNDTAEATLSTKITYTANNTVIKAFNDTAQKEYQSNFFSEGLSEFKSWYLDNVIPPVAELAACQNNVTSLSTNFEAERNFHKQDLDRYRGLNETCHQDINDLKSENTSMLYVLIFLVVLFVAVLAFLYSGGFRFGSKTAGKEHMPVIQATPGGPN